VKCDDRTQLADIVTGAVGVLWIWFAITKFMDLEAFRGTVAAHGLLPPKAVALLPLVPAVELLIGALLPASPRRHAWRMLLLSLAVLGALCLYLSLVPSAALARVGCGCAGSVGNPQESAGAGWAIRNGGFAVLHAAALVLSRPHAKRARNQPVRS
jgi:hypothetical protein